jgi:hypothetical protein
VAAASCILPEISQPRRRVGIQFLSVGRSQARNLVHPPPCRSVTPHRLRKRQGERVLSPRGPTCDGAGPRYDQARRGMPTCGRCLHCRDSQNVRFRTERDASILIALVSVNLAPAELNSRTRDWCLGVHVLLPALWRRAVNSPNGTRNRLLALMSPAVERKPSSTKPQGNRAASLAET